MPQEVPPAQDDKLNLVLITGLSGAGKTLALKTMEDLDYFCIDNLPVSLLDPLVVLLKANENIRRAALVMDVRDPQFIEEAQHIPERLNAYGHDVTLLFLEADKETLIRRFSETRRPHPLARKGSIEQGVDQEIELLKPLRAVSSRILDTSELNVHQLKSQVGALVTQHTSARMNVLIQSFGFKYGIPLESAFVFDVRFLPNPYFEEHLRDRSGKDPEVANYVFAHEDSKTILDRIIQLVETAVPMCRTEGRSNLLIGIGCTGGQHRSVAIAEKLGEALAERNISNTVIHKELPRYGL